MHRRPRVVFSSALLVAAALLVGSCRPSASPLDPELLVEPQGFEAMDSAAKEQFRDVKEALELQIEEGAGDAALGQASGRLAMWFHAYQLRERAIALYGVAETLQPKEPRWIYFQGLLLAAAGRLPEAIEKLSRCAELMPEYVPLKIRLGSALAAAGDDAAAGPWLEQALESRPGSVKALVSLAEIRRREGRFDDAAAMLSRAMVNEPSSSQIRYLLGLSLRDAGRIEEAKAHLEAADNDTKQKVLGLPDPLFAEVTNMDVGVLGRLRRARLAMERRRYLRALAEFRAIVDMDPNQAQAAFGRIRALLALERFAEAEVAATEAVTRFPDQPRSHFLLGRALAEAGSGPEALSRAMMKYRDALDEDAGFVSALVALADAHDVRGEPNRALEVLSRARAEQRSRGELLGSLSIRYARALVAAEKRSEAVQALREDVEMTQEPWALQLMLDELGVAVDP